MGQPVDNDVEPLGIYAYFPCADSQPRPGASSVAWVIKPLAPTSFLSWARWWSAEPSSTPRKRPFSLTRNEAIQPSLGRTCHLIRTRTNDDLMTRSLVDLSHTRLATTVVSGWLECELPMSSLPRKKPRPARPPMVDLRG